MDKPKNIFFRRKLLLALALLVIGGYMGSAAIVADVYENAPSWTWVFMCAGIGFVVLGSILGLTEMMDATAREVVVHVAEGLEDEKEQLDSGIMPWSLWQFGISAFATLVFTYLLLRYHKLESTWTVGPVDVPVWMPTLVAIAVMVAIVIRTRWFNDTTFDTPWFVFAIAAAALVIGGFFGVWRTEDTRLVNPAYRSDSVIVYNSYRTSFSNFGGSGYSGYDVPDVKAPSCSGKSCEGLGYLICCALFVVVVLILLVGCALINNFWIFACGLFIAMMWLITWQSLMVRPRRSYIYG